MQNLPRRKQRKGKTFSSFPPQLVVYEANFPPSYYFLSQAKQLLFLRVKLCLSNYPTIKKFFEFNYFICSRITLSNSGWSIIRLFLNNNIYQRHCLLGTRIKLLI